MPLEGIEPAQDRMLQDLSGLQSLLKFGVGEMEDRQQEPFVPETDLEKREKPSIDTD
jgi:hypothetical protein